MGKGGCSREAGRIIMWMAWVTVWLVTSIYVALSVISFGKLWQAATEFQFGGSQLAHNKIWRAPLAALALGAALVFGFNMMSCITLIKKSVNRSGPGFGYGFMMAFSISLSFFLLLCGLVLDGFRPEVQANLEPKYDVNGTFISGAKSWSSYSSEGFIGAEAMALVSFSTYFLFGFLLIILQTAISDQLGINAAAGYGAGGGGGAAAGAGGAAYKDAPAIPAEYDQYAQYAQYGNYAQDEQQYYDPNTTYQVQAIPTAVDATGTAGYYSAPQGGYTAPEPQNWNHTTAAAAPLYANTGFAAVSGYAMTDHSTPATGLLSGQPAYGQHQQI